MGKIFRDGTGGELLVGSNAVFDFGHLLGIVRSISWGSNIPIGSPFFAGNTFFYHVFFPFWSSLFEYMGLTIVQSVNIPSIVSFSGLLIVIYVLTQILGGKKPIVGWIAVLLTITHSTNTFWYMLFNKGLNISFIRSIWQLPAYPYAGPFDGSVISIFMTLNNYVNQRHLAFSIGLGLLISFLFWHTSGIKKTTIARYSILGLLTGLLFFWNMSVFLLVTLYLIGCSIVHQTVRGILICIVISFVTVCIFSFPFFLHIQEVLAFIRLFYQSGLPKVMGITPHWSMLQYFWDNLGILPLLAIVGWFVVPKKSKSFFGVYFLLFILISCLAAIGKRGYDQKFLSFSIVGVNMLAACFLGWLWDKGIVMQIGSILCIFLVSISGFVDLMVIKNDFAFPLVSNKILPVISWIQKQTPKDAVFVSYSDIIDPVALSGRKNYFGFFGNTGSYDRSHAVRNIYAGDRTLAKSLNISYILVPVGKKNDFPYDVDDMYFREHGMVGYEDERFIIYKIDASNN